MFMAQCFRFGVRRCSPLNSALCGWRKIMNPSAVLVH
ncbi:glyoxalase/bleomycin resistance/dioxygenase family protein, partial [Vibrio parahaemolyticus]